MLQCGTTNKQLKIELLSQWKLEAEFHNISCQRLERLKHLRFGKVNSVVPDARHYLLLGVPWDYWSTPPSIWTKHPKEEHRN